MRLINGDCLIEMDKLIKEDIKVDAIITDPPYGTTACKWDSVIPFEPMWKQLNRVIKPNGAIVLFGSEPFSSYLRLSNIKNYKYDWIWEKTQSRGHLLAYKRPMVKHELISVFNSVSYYPILKDKPLKDIRPYSISGKTDIYNNKSVEQKKTRKIPLDKKLPESILLFPNTQRTVHNTQKPVALMEYLIKTYTLENEIVLDFTMGSGTTGVACVNTNRKFIGIEKDKNYFNIAKKRIEENTCQMELF